MRFQTTLEGAECLRRSDAGWHSVPGTRRSDEERAVTNRRMIRRWCDKGRRVDEDRSLFLVSTSTTRGSSLARYSRAVPCRHRKTRTESLNSIRSDTRSQCRSRSSGVMCSYFRRANKSCSGVHHSWLPGRPASVALP